MMKYLNHILAAVLAIECLAGIVVNVIILAVILVKRKTLRSLQTYYKILSCLALSRSLYLLSSLFYHIVVFYSLLVDTVIVLTIRVKTTFLFYTNLWFATVLCVFYCVKLIRCNNHFWIFLKTKISTSVSWFLLASLFLSLSCSLPFGFYVNLEPNNLTNVVAEHMTVYNEASDINLPTFSTMFLLGSCPPFLIFCATVSLLLHSLWMHTRRMRSSGSSFQSPNLESLFNAVKSMSLFLVMQIMYFIVANVYLSCRLHQHKVWKWIFAIINSSPLLFHSLYIISSNSELRKTCISIFCTLTRAAPS